VTNERTSNGRSIGEIMAEFKEELKDFAITRAQMLRSEISEKVGAWKAALPAIAIGAFLLIVAAVLLTAGLVSVIALAFQGQPWAYAAAFFIVMAIYGLAGGVLLVYGWKTLKAGGLAPQRTMRVLKEDQAWFKTEARTQV
jgi:cytochrome c biogenesis factor